MTPPARVLRDRRARPRPAPGDPLSSDADLPWPAALRRHWPEYGIEGLFLALFVIAAGLVAAELESPASALHVLLPEPLVRRLLAGLVAGLVIAAMVYSPWGRRSGTHLNPAITLAFLRLGKVGQADAVAYVAAQVAGGLLGVAVLRSALAALLPVATPIAALATPAGPANELLAFAVELVLSAATMLMILFTSNHASWYRWTGALYALMVAAVVTFVSPLSGFGMNPARLLAIDLASGVVDAGWLNLLAPLAGMVGAVDAYRLLTRRKQVLCAKLAHNVKGHCIFRCQHPDQALALARAAVWRRSADGLHE
ncbi:MAG: aquaporin [Betaproteobacteria bacterium]